jgi:hypothetical protein
MPRKANTITTKILTVVLALAPAVLFAHGGFDHVIGTVVQVSNNVLTVKTVKGNVDVKLDEKTEISKGDQKVLSADLKQGLRVIVDIPEGSKDKIAHSVKVGVASPSAHAEHGAQ